MSHDVEISAAAFLKAWQDRRLVAGCLKTAHVRPHTMLYEDLMQEGVIVYAAILTQEPNRPPKYIFRKVLWRLYDLLRQAKRCQAVSGSPLPKKEREASNDSALDVVLLKERVASWDFLMQSVFFDHLVSGVPLSVLADRHTVSKRTLFRVKKQVLSQLQPLSADKDKSAMKIPRKCVK